MSKAGQQVEPQKVAVIGSLARSLVNFRLDLMTRMIANGHQVVAMAPEDDAEIAAELGRHGIAYRSFPMARTGINPLEDLRTIRALTRHLRAERPDIVLPYTMKPIIYGNMAARLAGVGRRFALFTGLGYTFEVENPTGRRALVRAVAIRLYRLGLRGLERAFVYNPAEAEDVARFRLVPRETPVTMVPGSGINTERFAPTPPPTAPVRFLMISRILRSKGVDVYVEAARRLKARHPDADVCLLGPLDANPTSLNAAELDALAEEGVIRYLGETTDVRPFIAEASVIVLPNIFREGIPRTILEALASGRPAITTDVPGSAHSLRNGESGVIVPAGDAEALAGAMATFVEDPKLIVKMGTAGRRQACEEFDVHRINHLLLTSMGLEAADERMVAPVAGGHGDEGGMRRED